MNNKQITIINIDCMEYMASMEDNFFELAIVDPPYGIGNTWSKSRTDRFYKRGKLHDYKNNTIPPPEYFAELIRISKNQIIWGGNYYTDYLSPTNSWIIWNKLHNMDTFTSMGEMAWTSFRKPLKIVDYLWDGARKCEIIDKIHPHQKPVLLYKWLLHHFAKPGDKIFDSHMGSASLAVACHDYGFEFTGCEIDSGYFYAASKRLNIHTSQISIPINHQ